MSFVREDLTYFVLPPGKLSTPDLHALKQRVGDWLVAKTDIFAGLQISSQWNHTLYFLLLS
jgi:hypothetical protein